MSVQPNNSSLSQTPSPSASLSTTIPPSQVSHIPSMNVHEPSSVFASEL